MVCCVKRAFVSFVLAIAAIATTIAMSSPATAAGVCGTPSTGHCYSNGYEQSGSNYSGVKITRQDLGLAPSYCVSQPAWVQTFPTAWVELGSEYGNDCTGPANTWYWGYTASSMWHLLGTRALNVGQTHVFSVYYYLGYYYYYVDSTNLGNVYDARFFSAVAAGLESTDPYATIGPFQISSMQYTASGGSWQSWAGKDGVLVTPKPLMCGAWKSATSWAAQENLGGSC
jgi:hypothetical protein